MASAEALLNRQLAASSRSAALARRLDATSLEIDVVGFARVRVQVAAGRIGLSAGEDSPADTTITGSVTALLQLLKFGGQRQPRAPRSAGAGPAPAIQIRGDAEIANLYRDLLVAARPDLEEELSRWIGDLPARRLAQAAKGLGEWARRARRTAGENIAEYLQEESRDLINRPEAEEFLRGVDEVREAADRIEARLNKLELRIRDAH
jgi:ubiquinone biosynthesis protein UbiJ